MEIAIYQVNIDRDGEGVAFESFDRYKEIMNTDKVSSNVYDKVFEGEVDCNGLEDVYRMFNIDMPQDYKGRSLSVSDVVEVVDSDEVEKGFYYCDSIGYKKVDFNPNNAGTLNTKTIKVVLVEPGKFAKEVEIGTDLKDLQEVVGGDIEAFYPFEEEVCIVCNDEGKFNGSSSNRAIYNSDGEMMDIIFGTFFICSCDTEEFTSLSNSQINKYKDMYYYPEKFMRVNGDIQAMKCEKEFKAN